MRISSSYAFLPFFGLTGAFLNAFSAYHHRRHRHRRRRRRHRHRRIRALPYVGIY